MGERWEVMGWRRFRERPLLYNISCVSKALTALLPEVVKTVPAMSVFVCGFQRGGGRRGLCVRVRVCFLGGVS